MPPSKRELAALARAAPEAIVSPTIAANVWGVSGRTASRRLAVLARGGWLRRIRRGHYQIVPLESDPSIAAPYDDPWVLALTLYAPCYVGGCSAAEHWGLTEQLFRETFVVTGGHVRATRATAAGLEFRLARVDPNRAIGDASVWHGAVSVPTSSPERTLIDGANAPVWVGGIRHLSEMLNRYVATPSRDVARLAHVLDSHGRGAGAKRLGFVAENLERGPRGNESRDFLRAIREFAMPRITKGIVKLDPAVHGRGRMNARWGLWVNADVSRSD